MRRMLAALVVMTLVTLACGGDDGGETATTISSREAPADGIYDTEHTASSTTASSTTAPSTTTSVTTSSTTTTTTLPDGVSPRPEWLGTRPIDPEDGPFDTPEELSDRRLASPDLLPPPPDDRFHSSIGGVPPEVEARATWSQECPVSLDDLAYITVTFLGFDGAAHTGELLVAEDVATDIVGVFATVYEAEFPIEEMRVTSPADLEAEPTGDGNATAAFVCRPVTNGSDWSEHAYGLAIDVNPFHNPYVRGDVVLPELAADYVDRDRHLPGMITDGGVVVDAFNGIGWEWGGHWSSLKDYQHFSLRGR